MKYIRFVTYLVLLAALWTTGRVVNVIPLSLKGPTEEASDYARFTNLGLERKTGILDCVKSGREVTALAKDALRTYRTSGTVAEVPVADLENRNGRIWWVLRFAVSDPAPGDAFSVKVEIEDCTGEIIVDGKEA